MGQSAPRELSRAGSCLPAVQVGTIADTCIKVVHIGFCLNRQSQKKTDLSFDRVFPSYVLVLVKVFA